MKVISELLAISFLDSIRMDARLMVGFMESNFKMCPTETNGFDLDRSRKNLEAIERKIQIIKEESFSVSSIYQPRETA